jgi:hypothetical protein
LIVNAIQVIKGAFGNFDDLNGIDSAIYDFLLEWQGKPYYFVTTISDIEL